MEFTPKNAPHNESQIFIDPETKEHYVLIKLD